MTTDKFPNKSETKSIEPNPLADIAGKFGGKFWLETQSQIERSRKKEREEIKRILDTTEEQDWCIY